MSMAGPFLLSRHASKGHSFGPAAKTRVLVLQTKAIVLDLLTKTRVLVLQAKARVLVLQAKARGWTWRS
jgi:hypothetical protein